MKKIVKNAGAVLGSAMLLSSGVAAITALQPAASFADDGTEVAALESRAMVAENESGATKVVEGTFSFEQNVVSSNASITAVFAKAAATLCQAAPEYAVQAAVGKIMVVAPDGTSVDVLVEEGDGEDGIASRVLACACATNAAGGGAVMNAEVQGTSIQSLAAMANAVR